MKKRPAALMRLKGLRVENKISQIQMSKLLKISPATYNSKENGHRHFNKYEIDVILRLFKMDYEEVFSKPAKRVYIDEPLY